jgi:hypothetical protein
VTLVFCSTPGLPLNPPLAWYETDNFCGLAVSKTLSSVHRTLIDTMRTVAVWSVDVAIYYSLNGSQYGEKWEGKWSGVQVIACVLLASVLTRNCGCFARTVGWFCMHHSRNVHLLLGREVCMLQLRRSSPSPTAGASRSQPRPEVQSFSPHAFPCSLPCITLVTVVKEVECLLVKELRDL